MFLILLYCLEKDISGKKELAYLNLLCKHHGFNWMKLNAFEVTEIISVNKNY